MISNWMGWVGAGGPSIPQGRGQRVASLTRTQSPGPRPSEKSAEPLTAEDTVGTPARLPGDRRRFRASRREKEPLSARGPVPTAAVSQRPADTALLFTEGRGGLGGHQGGTEPAGKSAQKRRESRWGTRPPSWRRTESSPGRPEAWAGCRCPASLPSRPPSRTVRPGGPRPAWGSQPQPPPCPLRRRLHCAACRAVCPQPCVSHRRVTAHLKGRPAGL